MRRLRKLAVLLRAHDIPVEEFLTDRPGYLVWEDDHQMAAVPFGETRAR